MSDGKSAAWDAAAQGAIEGACVHVVPSALEEKRPGFKMRLSHAKGSNLILICVAVCALLLFAGGMVFARSYDNDVWFFLATGEYIVEHGIPYTNPFSIHEGMDFVAQQWLHCVISYTLYSAGGFVAMGIWVTALFLILAFSMLMLGWKLRGTRSGSEVVMVLVAVCIIAASAYTTVRPHLYSMIAFVWIVWLCESYRATEDKRYLFVLPVITCLHVNIHAAIAPYDLFIIACYAIPDVLAPFHRRGHLLKVRFADIDYARIPLLVALIVSALALLVNPYGIKGACYLVLSLGSASYRDRINEMGRFVPASEWQDILNTVLMFVTVLVAGRIGAKRINLPLVVLALFAIIETMAYLRNQWINALFCFMYLVWATRQVHLWGLKAGRAVKTAGVCIVLAGALGMVGLQIQAVPSLEKKPEDSLYTPVHTVRYLDSLNIDKENTKVFTFFNAGGYLEYCGFKVNVDPRPEIWDSNINGMGYNFYREYVEMAVGDMAFNRYNAYYDFDVFFIDSDAGTDVYFEGNDRYVEIQGGAGYSAYAKKSWIDQYV